MHQLSMIKTKITAAYVCVFLYCKMSFIIDRNLFAAKTQTEQEKEGERERETEESYER